MLLIIMPLFFAIKNIQASGRVKTEQKPVNLPIVLYHEVKTQNVNKFVVTPCEFESDLKYLKENGYTTVTMADVINFVYSDAKLPEKPVILSFDDGYLNNYVYAVPLLKKYNMKIVLSLIAKDSDNFTKSKDSNLDYSHMNWDQLNEILKSDCVEIQNHTYNLHAMTKKRYGCKKKASESLSDYEQILSGDLMKCQLDIFQHTGRMPTTFTYPYGVVSKESLPVIKNLGFKASLSCKYGINVITNDPERLYCMKRISRYHGTSVGKTINEALKTLKFQSDSQV